MTPLEALSGNAPTTCLPMSGPANPVLDFDYELIADARRFERPANALLHITRFADDCLEDCLVPAKPPVIIVDPRAGHGPGIGGFKRESEVGIALHEGHPVYFVMFFPEPCSSQTLADVLHASRYAFASAFNPWLRALAPIASGITQDRHCLPDDNRFKAREAQAFDASRDLIAQWRRLRDLTYERVFDALYGSVGSVSSSVPPKMETGSTLRTTQGSSP